MSLEDYNYNKGEDLNSCAICHKQFKEGDSVSIVSPSYGPFLLVHKDCINKYGMAEGTRQEEVYSEEPLQENDKLWRYMDLSKFISMMMNKSLYFSSPSQFDDIYEGAHGEMKNKQKWDDFYLNSFRASIITAPDNCWHKVDEKELEGAAQRLLDEITNGGSKWVYINCWYHNEYESEAMWKMYSTSIENAIAIQTTYGKLHEELGKDIQIHPVRYIDYEKNFAGPNEVYWCKRKAFEYEQEVRAISYDYKNEGKIGEEIEVNLNNLIDNVYVSPYAYAWLQEVITDLIQKYGFTFNVHESNMKGTPF